MTEGAVKAMIDEDLLACLGRLLAEVNERPGWLLHKLAKSMGDEELVDFTLPLLNEAAKRGWIGGQDDNAVYLAESARRVGYNDEKIISLSLRQADYAYLEPSIDADEDEDEDYYPEAARTRSSMLCWVTAGPTRTGSSTCRAIRK